MFRRTVEFQPMTVAEAFGAHACAQMTAARAADEARRVTDDTDQIEVIEESRSFVDSWAISATVIGIARAN